MKKDVLLIVHYVTNLGSEGNNRFNYLTKLLSNENLNLELVTSEYSHSLKKRKPKINNLDLEFKVTYIREPGYEKNVSLKRIFSHYKMAQNMKKYLNKRDIPDLIYCAVPSLSVAHVAAKYAKRHNVKFIIDIQDVWPEAFKMVLDIPIISNLIFHPMTRKANYIYKEADEIVAVSKTYANLALEKNNKCKQAHNIYIGTNLKTFDKLKAQGDTLIKPKNELWLAYIGTLGHSYNIPLVMDALAILNKKGITNIKFIIMGDGPLRKEFQEYAIKNNISAEFTGRLDYGEMVSMLSYCDIVINPISKGSAASIINKHADYAAAGLPVINTQESREYRDLVDHYNIGFNCDNDNVEDLVNKLSILYKNEDLRIMMGNNHRIVAEKMFDRTYTYTKILDIINYNLSLERPQNVKKPN